MRAWMVFWILSLSTMQFNIFNKIGSCQAREIMSTNHRPGRDERIPNSQLCVCVCVCVNFVVKNKVHPSCKSQLHRRWRVVRWRSVVQFFRLDSLFSYRAVHLTPDVSRIGVSHLASFLERELDRIGFLPSLPCNGNFNSRVRIWLYAVCMWTQKCHRTFNLMDVSLLSVTVRVVVVEEA
jgi:hypothetical protein